MTEFVQLCYFVCYLDVFYIYIIKLECLYVISKVTDTYESVIDEHFFNSALTFPERQIVYNDIRVGIQEGVCITLDGARVAALGEARLALALRGGQLYVLTLLSDSVRSVRSFHLDRAAASVLTSCVSTHCGTRRHWSHGLSKTTPKFNILILKLFYSH